MHILRPRIVGEIDRFGDGVIDVTLKGRLHLQVLLRRDFEGRHEKPLDLFGHALNVAESPLFHHLICQTLCIGAVPVEVLAEERSNLVQDLTLEDVRPPVGQGKEGLDAGGRARDEAQRPGGRDGGARRVPNSYPLPGMAHGVL